MAEIILPPEENEETPQAPELNIDKPTENSKVITIEFEAKKTNKVSTKDTNQQLYTTDTDAWFEFKETSLEGANGTYSVVFRNRHDGSIFQRTGDVVGGVAYYKIPHQEIRHAGAWRGQVVYTLSNGDTTAREFDYDVKGHILDGKDVREIVVEDFETLMSQLNSMKDNAEQELADLVNTAERNELERQQFYESLVEDINDLQENYQELLDTGVLQTNINTKLEALEEEYAPKLTEVTAQLAQTQSQKVDKDGSGQIRWSNIAQDARENISGGKVAVVGVDSVISENITDNAVTGDKIAGAFTTSKTKNLFNKFTITEGAYLSSNHGGVVPSKDWAYSDYIRVEPGERYRKNFNSGTALYDINKEFISGLAPSTRLQTDENTYYIRVSIPINDVDMGTVIKSSEWTDEYVPYEEEYVLSDAWNILLAKHEIKDNSITGEKLFDVWKTSITRNLFNKDDMIEGGYLSASDGRLVLDPNYISTGFILVEPDTTYRKSWVSSTIFYDQNKEFIGSSSLSRNFRTPENAKYIRTSILRDDSDTATIMKGTEWVDEYVPYEEGYIFGKSWKFGQAQQAQATRSTETFLRVPTPYHDGTVNQWATHQSTHPSVHQFEEEWNGYKYWMVHTPYPYENEKRENPCVAVSNNGIKWEEPSGVVNPLAEPGTETGHLSDGHIFYNEQTSNLEIWYREVIRTTPRQEVIKRVVSSNGVAWTEPETMFTHTSPDTSPNSGAFMLSPSVIYHDGKYKMWYTDNRLLFYIESIDGLEWNEPVEVTAGDRQVYSWHTGIVLHDGKYHLLMLDSDLKGLKYAYAEEGQETIFSEPTSIIAASGQEWELDGKYLYRATPLWTSRGVMVIYGTVSQQNIWLLHAQSGKDFYNLKPITPKAFEFYGIE